MFNVDLVMKVGSTVGNIADNSSELLGFLDDLTLDTDFRDETRENIFKEIDIIENSLAKITLLLSSEIQGE